jgi:phospholipid transport system transporter-binding protein
MTETNSISKGKNGAIILQGELTFSSVPELYLRAEELLDSGSSLAEIDLAEVTAADSAGLALLLEWQAAHQSSGKLQIRNAPASLISLARLCEADELLDLSGRDSVQ